MQKRKKTINSMQGYVVQDALKINGGSIIKHITKVYDKCSVGFNSFSIIFLNIGILWVINSLLFINTVQAQDELPPDCVYYDEEMFDYGTKVCHYDCNFGTKDLVIKDNVECPRKEEE